MGGKVMNKPISDPIIAARSRFPALKRWIYLDLGGRGVLSREVRAALNAHLDERMNNGADKNVFFENTERVSGRFSELINATPDEIAYTKNVSEGLNMVATAFDWKPGDNVILCPELEHPNNIYPWLNMRRHGLETRFIQPREGHMPVDEIGARMAAPAW